MAGINIYLAVVKRHLEDVNMDLADANILVRRNGGMMSEKAEWGNFGRSFPTLLIFCRR